MEPLGLRDIIGPIMVGPSSSHTAGALRIARMARRLLSESPTRAQFTLYGSFAHTGTGHGTDKALVAGLLGLDADDLRIRNSFALAEEAGLDFTFERASDAEAERAGVEHPNTVDILLADASGLQISVRGVSVGGGAAAIRRIDGVDVDISGKCTSVVVHQRDERGVLAHISQCMAIAQVNIATARLYRTRRGSDAYTVMEVDGGIPDTARDAIMLHPAVSGVRVVPAETADAGHSTTQLDDAAIEAAEKRFDACNYTSGAELLALCAQKGCTISEVFLERERALSERNGAESDTEEYLAHVLDVMRESAEGPLHEPVSSVGGLIGGEAHRIAASLGKKAGAETTSDPSARLQPVVDGIAANAMLRAMAVLETNASMGRIVATPTAGSAGVLPGVLLALEAHLGLDRDSLVRGLLCAAAVGYLAARNATVSGAEGGCQAEVGTAAAMAAAAAVELAGGTPEQALDAASNALCCLMGLVCDPVGGLVEVPCQKRNGAAASVALSCAQMALAGIPNLVPFDQTLAAMDAVGRTLPPELRETALGGIAAAPAACARCR